MEKRNTFELLLAGALLGGAFYFLFYTERGRQLREKLTDTLTDKLDEWLEAIEQELAEAEKTARENKVIGSSS